MPEHEFGGKGMEVLSAKEKELFLQIQEEIIALSHIYNSTGRFQANEGQMIIPMRRMQDFENFLQKTGLAFEDLGTPLQEALRSLGLVQNFFPEVSVSPWDDIVEEDSARPDVENPDRDIIPHATLMNEKDGLRKELGTLIKTVESNMKKNVIEPSHLTVLCDEIIRQCKVLGGVETYVNDPALSDFILQHSSAGGRKRFDDSPTPAAGTPRPEQLDSSSKGNGLLKAVARLFNKK